MKYALILPVLWLCHSTVQAQTDTTRTQTDSAQINNKKVTLTLGTLYSNNANYYGQTATKTMAYVAASATLQFRSGIYFSGMGYRLLNDSGSIVSATSAGAGIAFKMGKKLTADLSYSHTFFPVNSPFLQAANTDNAAGSLKYHYWMTSGVNVDYAFGKQQDIFVTLSTEKLIRLGSFSKRKDLITLTPLVEAVGGTQHFYQAYVKEKKLLGLPLPLLPGIPGTSETVTQEATRFDLLSYSLRVPLAYNRAHYMIELAYQLSVLSDKALSGAGNANSFFNCSFYYQF
ncbi:hypothetical protein CLV51_102200 [Chitinophaga niastensis]|uniref:Uncharacterized protein n=1 Tax=Chitinophaga niastensis TaxID=536980 RepID=A0A2P8HMA9_CHINA|nr:hypothetical protein [Chitinophaga niastensis]PSL47354.1 hypothetical protein CLV51_102200 [Chitinophaga niastensis]